jgi:hypothetical protein
MDDVLDIVEDADDVTLFRLVAMVWFEDAVRDNLDPVSSGNRLWSKYASSFSISLGSKTTLVAGIPLW